MFWYIELCASQQTVASLTSKCTDTLACPELSGAKLCRSVVRMEL